MAAASAEEVTAPETPPAEEDGYKLDHSVDAAAAQLEAAVEEAPKLRTRAVKARGPKSGLGKTPTQVQASALADYPLCSTFISHRLRVRSSQRQ